jgi:curli biogenesis system outer membrane secretion channel CsgG
MRRLHAILTGLVMAALLYTTPRARAGGDGEDPLVDHSKTSEALKALPRKPLAERTAVTIYQFRSSSYQVTPAAATDMFTAALIDSGQFRVVERAQVQQNVIREKPLNGASLSTGDSAQTKLRGAQYIFEGSVSEANAGENQTQGGVNIGGMNLGAGKNNDTIAVDVRILDADTGNVLDSVNIRKAVASTGENIGGSAAFASIVASLFHKPVSPMIPDVNYQGAKKEGLDKALRACIDASVM